MTTARRGVNEFGLRRSKNVYGNAAMKSKREANSKVVQMIMKPDTQNTQSANAA